MKAGSVSYVPVPGTNALLLAYKVVNLSLGFFENAPEGALFMVDYFRLAPAVSYEPTSGRFVFSNLQLLSRPLLGTFMETLLACLGLIQAGSGVYVLGPGIVCPLNSASLR